MDLSFNFKLADGYKSSSQITRVLTESWFEENMFCPRCGNLNLEHLPNNRAVADFICPICKNQYELKSVLGNFGNKIVNGAYNTFIERITSNQNPDFLFLNYTKEGHENVKNLIFIPKHFFVPEIIERRNPLSHNAQRHDWIGSNILINHIPQQGRIFIIKDGEEIPKENIIYQVRKSLTLENPDIHARGWLLDTLNCVNKIPNTIFNLTDIYEFEEILSEKHSNNHNIKPKIRQQLQILRDKGFIKFLGNGIYQKVE